MWTLNGTPVVRGTLTHPARGTWHALLQTTDTEAPAGSVTLAMPGLSLIGTMAWSGIFAGQCRVRVVGGAGKLAAALPGQHFRQALGRSVAQFLCQAAGETYDPASDATALGNILPLWTSFAGPLSGALDSLCAALGCAWWLVPGGQVHFGTIAFPGAARSDLLVQDIRHDLKRLDLAMESAPALPRTTVTGPDGAAYQVLAVDHEISARGWRAKARYL